MAELKPLKDYPGYFYDDKFIYFKQESGLLKLAVFEDGFYKLRMFNGAPILEIDGLRMQLVKDFKTPLDYAKQVVALLKPKKHEFVLDTCMGLGYTATEAAKTADRVTTCEISKAVLALARWNPFSNQLFTGKNIRVIEGSIAEIIKNMRPGSFDVIIHDPPRFSKAGELYSLEFYRELFRVSSPGARLFHYVGSVGKGKGRSIASEVSKRLLQAGFSDIRAQPRLQGLLFRK